MANLTTVGLTNGGGTSGTGTVSTLDNLIGIAGTASTNVLTVQGIASGVAQPVSGTVAATQSGTWNVGTVSTLPSIPAGSNKIGSIEITDGTNTATVKAASTAPVATDQALVVSLSPNSVNANGRKTPANSAPVVMASQQYQSVAASSTATVLGTTGAVGDWLDFILIVPATTAAGAVSITDGTGSAISIWAGGGTTALTSLVPFTIPVRAVSASGAWKVTTGTNVSVLASGNFT